MSTFDDAPPEAARDLEMYEQYIAALRLIKAVHKARQEWIRDDGRISWPMRVEIKDALVQAKHTFNIAEEQLNDHSQP